MSNKIIDAAVALAWEVLIAWVGSLLQAPGGRR